MFIESRLRVNYAGNMNTGQRLRDLRKAHKLSQEALGEPAGLVAQQVSRIEKNQQPLKLPELEAMCEHMGVSLAEFFGADAPQAPLERINPATMALVITAQDGAGLTDYDAPSEAKADVIVFLYRLASDLAETGLSEEQIIAHLTKAAPDAVEMRKKAS